MSRQALSVSQALHRIAINLREAAEIGEVTGQRGRHFVTKALDRIARLVDQQTRLAEMVESWGPEPKALDAHERAAEIAGWMQAPEQNARLTGDGPSFTSLVFEAVSRSKLKAGNYASPNGDVVRRTDAIKLWGEHATFALKDAALLDPTA